MSSKHWIIIALAVPLFGLALRGCEPVRVHIDFDLRNADIKAIEMEQNDG